MWCAWQQEADGIIKIWAQLSDDNCFQLAFIYFGFLLLSASCCGGRKGEWQRQAEPFASRTWKLNLPALLFKRLQSSDICLRLNPCDTVRSFCQRLNGLSEEGTCTAWLSLPPRLISLAVDVFPRRVFSCSCLYSLPWWSFPPFCLLFTSFPKLLEHTEMFNTSSLLRRPHRKVSVHPDSGLLSLKLLPF